MGLFLPIGVWTACRAAPLSMPAAARRRALRLAGQEQCDAGQDQDDADHGEGIAKAHHQRLLLDGAAERHDGLMAGAGRVGHAMNNVSR